jgi:hypothetical protein
MAREPHSPRIPSASEALAGAGAALISAVLISVFLLVSHHSAERLVPPFSNIAPIAESFHHSSYFHTRNYIARMWQGPLRPGVLISTPRRDTFAYPKSSNVNRGTQDDIPF